MKIDKKFFNTEDLIFGYEIYKNEVQVNDDVFWEDAYIFTDGYKKTQYAFLSKEELFDFIQKYDSNLFEVTLQYESFLDADKSITISKDDIKSFLQAIKNIENFHPEAQRLIKKYSWYYNFLYLFEDKTIMQSMDKYDVYSYYIKETGGVFYVNYKLHDEMPTLNLKNGERKNDIEILRTRYTLCPNILFENLSKVESEIIMRGLMLELSDKGQFIAGLTAQNYRNTVKHKGLPSNFPKHNKIDNEVDANDFISFYFPDGLGSNIIYDTIDRDSLAIIAFYDSSVDMVDPIISDWISAEDVIVKNKITKTVKAIIVKDKIEYLDYLKYKKDGKFIISHDDLREAILNFSI